MPCRRGARTAAPKHGAANAQLSVAASARALTLLACVSLTTLLSPPAAAQDPPELVFSEQTHTIEEGEVVTVTVTISPQLSMTSSVTVREHASSEATLNTDYTLTGPGMSALSALPFTLSLPANTGQVSFTVTAIADRMTEGNQDAIFELVAVSGAPYSLGSPSGTSVHILDASQDDVVVVDTDLDTAGAPRDPPPLSVAEGGTAKYTVVLTKEPGNSVMVAATETSDAISLTGAPLTFTSSNWSSAQTVTVTGVADDDNAVDEVATITHTVTSMDDDFSGAFASAVTVNVMDDDTPELNFSAESQSINEAEVAGDLGSVTLVGGAITIEVLISPPLPRDSSVTVQVAGSAVWNTDYTLTGPGMSALPFTLPLPANTEDATFTVTAISDTMDEGNENIVFHLVAISGAPYSLGATANTEVSLVDASVVNFSEATYTAAEKDEQIMITLEASPAPSNGFFLGIIPGSGGTAIEGADYNLGGGRIILSFAQGAASSSTVIPIVRDQLTEGAETFELQLELSSLQTGHVFGSQITATVTIQDSATDVIMDTDLSTMGVQITPLSVGEGSTAEYTVVLRSMPGNPVMVAAAETSDAISLTGGTLTFSTSNWNVAQTVTVAGEEDSNGVNESATITHTVTSTDSDFNNAFATAITVNVMDDDDPMLNFQLAEYFLGERGSDTVDVRIRRPLSVNSSVEVQVTGSATLGTDYTLTVVGGSTITSSPFTLPLPANAEEVSLDVTVIQDRATEGNETIMLQLAAIPNPPYSLGSRDSTEINIQDDSTAEVIVVDTDLSASGKQFTPLSVTEESADPDAEYTVVLASAPTHPVTVAVAETSDSITLGGLTNGALTFTTGNWETAQTVTVTAVDEDPNDNAVNEIVTITHTASSTDTDYNGETAAVTVNVMDADRPVNLELMGAVENFNVRETAPGNVANVVLLFTPPLPTDSSITLSAASGVAALGADYTLTVDGETLSSLPATLELPANTGNMTLTVTGIADRTTEGAESVTLLATPPADAPYSSTISGGDFVISVTDTSLRRQLEIDTDPGTGGVQSAPLAVSEGGTVEYTVVLLSAPSARVLVDVDVQGETRAISLGGLTEGNLAFSASNWDTEQTVTVTGAENDGNAISESVTIMHRLVSADRAFAGQTATALVRVMDNDTRELVLPPSVVLNIDETAPDNVATFEIGISPPLSADSSVTLNGMGAAALGDDYTLTVGGTSISSLPATVSLPKDTRTVTFTLTGIADMMTENLEFGETAVFSLTKVAGEPYSITAPPILLTIADTSLMPEVVITPTALTDLSEATGDMDTYTVRLRTLPSADVMIAAAADDADAVSISPTTLTFTSSTWDTEQTVTVAAMQDDDAASETVTISHTPTGATEYASLTPPDVMVDVSDDDVNKTFSLADAAILEGQAVGLTITLGEAAPDGGLAFTVTHNLATSTSAMTADVGTVPGTVTVPAGQTTAVLSIPTVADGMTEGATPETFTVTIATTVPGWRELNTNAGAATVSIEDADSPGVIIDANPATATLETALALDEGAMAEYTVVLRALPTADVTVAIAPDTTGAVTVSAASLIFTSGDWMTAQTVTVTALQDADTDDETVTLSHSASGPSEYTGLTLADVTVTVNDDDEPGVVIAPDPADPLTVAGGAAASYTLVLRTLPTAAVTVTAVSDMPEVATVSEALTFTSSNWSTAQTITVTGVAEGRAEISHRAGGAPEYDGLAIASVSVVVTPAPAAAAGNPDDEVSEALIPELSRVLAEGAVGAVARRIQRIAGGLDAGGGGGGTLLALGGQSSLDGLVRRYAPALAEGQLGLAELLDGSAFVLPLRHSVAGAAGTGGAAGGGRAAGGADAPPWLSTLTLWGSGEYRNLSDRSGGADDTLDWKGDLFSAQLGLDAQLHKDWLLGVAGSWGRGTMEYRYSGPDGGTDSGADRGDGRRRDYRLTLGSVLPYLAWSPGGGVVQLWLSGGYGQGELQRELLNDQQVQSDLQQRLVAGGASVRLLQQAHSSLRLHVQGQGAWTRIDGDARHNLAGQNVQANALRVALQGQRVVRLAGGAALTPDVELGLRHDGGDGDTGAAAQLGGALRYRSPQGLQAEGGGELLAGRGEYREWGLWGLVSWSARSDGRGWTLRLQPRYGMDSRTTGAGALGGAGNGQWGQWLQAGPRLDALGGPAPVSAQLDLRLGYGLARGLGLLSPYSELLLGAETRRFRMGVQWRLGEQWSMDLLGERIERRNGAAGGAGTDRTHSILLEGRIRR